MATAIVRSYTQDGFIVAADGREAVIDTGEVLSDCCQKIFQVGRYPVSYCATGATLLGDIGEVALDTVHFDFLTEIKRQVEEQGIDEFETLADWGRAVFLRVFDSLEKACVGGMVDLPTKLGKVGSSYTILTVFLDGYSNGNPESVTIRFSHENGVLLEPDVSIDDPSSSYWVYGSQKVAHALMMGSTAFRKYRGVVPPRSIQLSKALNEAIGVAIRYMKCCTSLEGSALDPIICPTIGGRIHIAKITPRVGFRWIPGFEPLARTTAKGRKQSSQLD